MNSYTVWYAKHPTFDEKAVPTTLGELFERFAKVKDIDAKGLEDVFREMQGENWSPNGEARPLIHQLGLTHTSMSVGDLAQTEAGIFYVVADCGFNRINVKRD